MTPSADPVSRAVSIPGPEGFLEGQLLEVSGAADAIIVVPGSGLTDRDGNSPEGLLSNSYKLLAESLAAEGHSVLRIDKRGMYGSAGAIGDGNAVTIADYADDVIAWAGFLRVDTGAKRIWIAGHSEGGLVALAAVSQSSGINGLILLATPGRRIGQILLSQFEAGGVEAVLLEEARCHIYALEQGKYIDNGDIHPGMLHVFHQEVQGFLHSLMRLDPPELLRENKCPCLVIQGGRDIQVQPDDCRLLDQAGDHVTAVTLDAMTHMLKDDVQGDPIATYQQPELPLSSGLVPAITSFISGS